MLCHRHYRRRSKRSTDGVAHQQCSSAFTLQPYQLRSRRGNARISRENKPVPSSTTCRSFKSKISAIIPFAKPGQIKWSISNPSILSVHLLRIFDPVFHSPSSTFTFYPTKSEKLHQEQGCLTPLPSFSPQFSDYFPPQIVRLRQMSFSRFLFLPFSLKAEVPKQIYWGKES